MVIVLSEGGRDIPCNSSSLNPRSSRTAHRWIFSARLSDGSTGGGQLTRMVQLWLVLLRGARHYSSTQHLSWVRAAMHHSKPNWFTKSEDQYINGISLTTWNNSWVFSGKMKKSLDKTDRATNKCWRGTCSFYSSVVTSAVTNVSLLLSHWMMLT